MVRRPLRWDLAPVEALRLVRDDAHPVALLGTWAGGADVVAADPAVVRSAPGPLADVFGPPLPAVEDGAFGGGWIGYLGYSAGGEALAPAGPRRLPAWWFGWYDNVLVRDRATGEWFFEALWTDARAAALERRFADLAARATEPAAAPRLRVRAVPADPGGGRPPGGGRAGGGVHPRGRHLPGQHLPAGGGRVRRATRSTPSARRRRNCSRRTRPSSASPPSRQPPRPVNRRPSGRRRRSRRNPPRSRAPPRPRCNAPGPRFNAARLRRNPCRVASLSPELFLRRTAARSRPPIKGTARRDGDPAETARNWPTRAVGQEPRRERDDRGPDAQRPQPRLRPGHDPGPRPATRRAAPRRVAPGLDVHGTLGAGVDDGDLIRAAFPPGSVTGAPKVRALEIIDELDGPPRVLHRRRSAFAPRSPASSSTSPSAPSSSRRADPGSARAAASSPTPTPRPNTPSASSRPPPSSPRSAPASMSARRRARRPTRWPGSRRALRRASSARSSSPTARPEGWPITSPAWRPASATSTARTFRPGSGPTSPPAWQPPRPAASGSPSAPSAAPSSRRSRSSPPPPRPRPAQSPPRSPSGR